jgi:hypothetical protein
MIVPENGKVDRNLFRDRKIRNLTADKRRFPQIPDSNAHSCFSYPDKNTARIPIICLICLICGQIRLSGISTGFNAPDKWTVESLD